MASKRNAPPADVSKDQDALSLLMADHKRVATLFAEFDKLKEDGSDDDKSAVVQRICQELSVHCELEEGIFYPAVRKAIDDKELMDESLIEHAGATDLVAQLEAADPEDDLYDAKVTVLAEQVDHHVQKEEKAMFPQAKRSGVDTMALGAKMLARKVELLARSRPPVAASAGSKAKGR